MLTVMFLLHHMDTNEVAQAVLVQYNGQFDNGCQTKCASHYPERLASVVLVDHHRADAPQRLERLAAGKWSGRIRQCSAVSDGASG